MREVFLAYAKNSDICPDGASDILRRKVIFFAERKK